MLSRLLATSVTLSLLTITSIVILSGPAAHAAGSGHFVCLDDPPPTTEECNVRAWAEHGPDGTLQVSLAAGGGGWLEECWRSPPRTVADAEEGPEWISCNDPTRGWYSGSYDCYFNANHAVARELDPLDPRVIYVDGTERGDEGTVHLAQCYFEHYTNESGWFTFDYYFLPPGEEPGPTEDPTYALVVEALDQLLLRGPTIGTAPPAEAGSSGLVRLPVWLWNEVDDTNWGSRSATATASGITAAASAEAIEIIWDMGDGTLVECDQGSAWAPGSPFFDPPCGHTYQRSSRHQPTGTYAITATTTWEVEWSVDGPNPIGGTVTLHPQAGIELRIDEIQVLTGRDRQP